MFFAVDDGTFVLGIFAPEEKDQVLFVVGEVFNRGVGEYFPALALMRAGLVGPDGEGGVEQKHPLLGPVGKVAGLGHGLADVGLKLLEDVLKRGGEGDAVNNRETEAVGLARAVVGILAENDNFGLINRAKVKGTEDVCGMGIDGVLPVFGFDEPRQLLEVGAGEFRVEGLFPGGFDVDGHRLVISQW